MIEQQMDAQQQPEGLPVRELMIKYKAWHNAKQNEQKEAQKARRYYHGKQWTDEEIRVLESRKQPVLTKNRCRRKIDFLVGMEQRLRQDPKGYPRNPNDEDAADVVTSGLRFVVDENEWEAKASMGAHEGFVSGIGGVMVSLKSKRGQLDPDIKVFTQERYFYDPRSLMPDFSDKRYDGLHDWVDIEDAKEMFPDKVEVLDSLIDTNLDQDGWTPWEEDKEFLWADLKQRRIRLVEMFYKYRGTWYHCFFVGDIKLYEDVSNFLDEDGKPMNPIETWSTYIDEEGCRYGLIRDMFSPQDEINKRSSKSLHLLNVRQLHVNESAAPTDDEDDLRTEVAKPDGVIRHNGEWGRDVGIVDWSQQIQGHYELLQESKAEIENIGPNPGLVGRGVEKQSGRAILAQQNSGMTELSPVFERLRNWKLRVYKQLWFRIKQAWQEERWIRITDEEGAAQFLGINQIQQGPDGLIQPVNALSQLDVDIILDEGVDTITMQEEIFDQITSLVGSGADPQLMKILIELSSLPNKKRVLKMLDGGDIPPEVQQEQMQKQKMLEDMQMADMQAEIEGKQKKNQEIDSKIELNRASALQKMEQAEKSDLETELMLQTIQ